MFRNSEMSPQSVRREFVLLMLSATMFAVCALETGCVQEMADQPRYKPLAASTAFDNGAASRPPVPPCTRHCSTA